MAEPQLFGRAALMHPLIPFAPPPQPGLAAKPVLVTAGARDPICPLPLTEAFTGWLSAQGAALTLHTHPGGHEIRQDELAALASFLTAEA
jgi:phospholipase/carboxylesterase